MLCYLHIPDLHARACCPPDGRRYQVLSNLDDGHLTQGRGRGRRVEGAAIVVVPIAHDATGSLGCGESVNLELLLLMLALGAEADV